MSSTQNTARVSESGSKKTPGQVVLNWTLKRMQATWFISPNDEQVVRIEHPVEYGATDEQWRSLLRSIGVRVKNDSKPWGPLARRDFLNMLENEHPDRMPCFFESKEAAEIELVNRRASSKTADESKIEDPESNEASSIPDEPDTLRMTMELLRQNPGANDLEIAAALGLKTNDVARMWKVKARELLDREMPPTTEK